MMCLQAEEAHLRALMLRKGQKRNCVLCPDIAHYLCALQILPAQTLLQVLLLNTGTSQQSTIAAGQGGL